MKKKLYIYNLILTVFTILTFTFGAAYAFFTGTSSGEPMPHFSANQAGMIEISSEFDLRLLSVANYYNDSNDTSLNESRDIGFENRETSVNGRKSIKFMSRIVLTEPLIVSSDLNIDLGGADCGLDLNGYDIIFRHNYYGCFLVTNGSIINSSTENASQVLVDTSNASVILDCTLDSSQGTVSSSILSFNKDALIEEIYAYTDSCFSSFYSEAFGVGENRYFIYKDLELPQRFYNYGLNLTWESGSTSVLSHDGKIQSIVSDTDVSLTLALSGGELESDFGGEITNSLSKIYNLKVLSGNRVQIGLAEITQYLEYYKHDNIIYISRDVELPTGNKYYGLTYSYATVDAQDISANTLRVTTKKTINLTATVSGVGVVSGTANFAIYVITGNNYQTANAFLSEINPLIIYDVNTQIPLTALAELEADGVSVQYSIVDSQEQVVNNYYIEDNIIKVQTLPYYTDLLYLKSVYTFVSGVPLEIERLSRIYFLDSSLGGGGSGGAGSDTYAAYYAYVSGLLFEQMFADDKTFTSFNMPNSYIDKGIAYDISCTTLERVESGGIISLAYPVDVASVATDYVIRLVPSGSNIFFEINTDKLKAEELPIEVTFIFIDEDALGNQITTIYDLTDTITLHGLIHNSEVGIPDNALYTAVLNVYDTDDDRMSGTPDGYLTLDEVRQSMTSFEIKDVTINNYKGIDFLTNTTGFILDNTGNGQNVDSEHVKYLRLMPQITNLSIINNSLTDSHLSRFEGLKNLEHLNLSNNSLTGLQNLNLIFTNVNELRLSGNSLVNLNGIENFLGLQNLYIDNNGISNFRILLDTASFEHGGNIYLYENYLVDGLGQPINTDKYGSLGKYNFATYIMLNKKGIAVYNSYDYVNDVPVLYNPQNADLEKGTHVLESIMLSKASDSYVILPVKIYIDQINYYTISWDYSELSVTATENDTPLSGEIRLTHNTAAGNVFIYAYIEINGTTVYRTFVLEVE